MNRIRRTWNHKRAILLVCEIFNNVTVNKYRKRGAIGPAYLIERSVIEPNRTPIVRLGLVIEHNELTVEFSQSNIIERSFTERSTIVLNRTFDYRTPVCLISFCLNIYTDKNGVMKKNYQTSVYCKFRVDWFQGPRLGQANSFLIRNSSKFCMQVFCLLRWFRSKEKKCFTCSLVSFLSSMLMASSSSDVIVVMLKLLSSFLLHFWPPLRASKDLWRQRFDYSSWLFTLGTPLPVLQWIKWCDYCLSILVTFSEEAISFLLLKTCKQ